MYIYIDRPRSNTQLMVLLDQLDNFYNIIIYKINYALNIVYIINTIT